ncbi:MAG: DUF1287 domain-containing protein [Candidatus Riflebacteria bacterium]|nr:DUF1287 domain-containing protein [Candidatus Riflebacteria bacterium]
MATILLATTIYAQQIDNGLKLVNAARKQVGVTIIYDPAYIKLTYPGGDVSLERGVCTDVIIRALRDARNIDLQKLIHNDIKTSFSAYPKIWGLRKPDKNIDHRRVANLQTFFKRNRQYAVSLPLSNNDYKPGDIVTCMLPGNRPHVMIVSDKTSFWGVPLVIHNIGSGAQEEDCLFTFSITGHYRLK